MRNASLVVCPVEASAPGWSAFLIKVIVMYEADDWSVYKDGRLFLVVNGDIIDSSVEEDCKTAEFLAMCLNRREKDSE